MPTTILLVSFHNPKTSINSDMVKNLGYIEI